MTMKKKQTSKHNMERGALIRIGATGISLTLIEKEGREVNEVSSTFFQRFPYGENLLSEGVIHQFHHIVPLVRTVLEELLVLLVKEKRSLNGIHVILEEPYAYARMYEFEFETGRIPKQEELFATINTDELERMYEGEVECFSLREQKFFLNGHPVSSSSLIQEKPNGEVKMNAIVSFTQKDFLSALREELEGHFPLMKVTFSSRAELFGSFVPFLTQKEEDHFHLIDINSLSTNVITRSLSGYLTFSSFSDGSLHIIQRVARELSYPFHKARHLFLQRGHEHFYETYQNQFQTVLLKSLREWESVLYTHLGSLLDEAELSPEVFYYSDTLLIEEEVGTIFDDPLFIDAFFPKREKFSAREMFSSLLPGKRGMQLRRSVSHQHLPAFLALHLEYVTTQYGAKKKKN